MNKERQKKIDFLSRKNQGRKMQEKVAEALATKLSVSYDSISFISLAETDKLFGDNMYRQVFSEQAVRTKKNWTYITTNQKKKIDLIIQFLEQTLENQKVCLMLETSIYTGGIEIDLKSVLTNYKDLIEFDGEDLVLRNLDNTFGLMLEYFQDVGVKVYRMSFWYEK